MREAIAIATVLSAIANVLSWASRGDGWDKAVPNP